MKKVLEVKNITKTYKEFKLNGNGNEIKACDNVSFNVHEGEILVFLGPIGAGKSTAIKIITTLATPTSGNVFIDGYSVFKEKEKAMESVGGVIESPDLYLDMSAIDNLRYFSAISNVEGNREKRIDEVLSIVGLFDRRKDKVAKYSLGMKQRLGIAQAILRKPKLLILDEPANGLDPSGLKEIRDMLKKFAREENMAILVSSHQLAEMELMCDRVIIINKGKIVGEKKIEELQSAQSGASLVISTDNIDLAKKIIKDKFNLEVEVEGKNIVLVAKTAPSEITKELVLGGVNVYGIKQKEISLEDAFFELTNGGKENV